MATKFEKLYLVTADISKRPCFGFQPSCRVYMFIVQLNTHLYTDNNFISLDCDDGAHAIVSKRRTIVHFYTRDSLTKLQISFVSYEELEIVLSIVDNLMECP